MARLFRELREQMQERDIDQNILGQALGMSSKSVSNRMTGAQDWSLSECYKALEFLGLPRSDIFIYFPPGGRQSVIDSFNTRLEVDPDDMAAIAAAVAPLEKYFNRRALIRKIR